MAFDGTQLVVATDETAQVRFIGFDPFITGAATVLGTHVGVGRVRGLAADGLYFYLSTPSGVYRVSRANLMAPALQLLPPNPNAALQVDNLIEAKHLYLGRRAVVAPTSTSPIDLGTTTPMPGGRSALDPSLPAAFAFRPVGPQTVIRVQ